MATKNSAYGDPVVQMAMDLMVPMVHPMAPLAPFRGDVTSTIANKSKWHQRRHWRQIQWHH